MSKEIITLNGDPGVRRVARSVALMDAPLVAHRDAPLGARSVAAVGKNKINDLQFLKDSGGLFFYH